MNPIAHTAGTGRGRDHDAIPCPTRAGGSNGSGNVGAFIINGLTDSGSGKGKTTHYPAPCSILPRDSFIELGRGHRQAARARRLCDPEFSHGWPLNADAWDGQMLFLAQA